MDFRGFPAGITYAPQQQELLAKDAPAYVCIHTQGYPANAGYDKIHQRTFGASIVPYLRGDWAPESSPFRLLMPDLGAIAYSGAEHHGNPKLPNITVVPNWQTQGHIGSPSRCMVMGSTMGHYHPPDPSGRRVQEVYEFRTPGLLVLDHENGAPQIWVAKEGDKVAIPDACHMTLYNLGEAQQPLITLDFADPARNPSDKMLIVACGPILLIHYDPFEVTFVLNRTYATNPTFPVGVHLSCTPTLADRSITIPRAGRMDLGSFLYAQLTGNPTVIGQFARLGLHLMPASPQATLEPVDGASDRRLTFTRPLVQAAVPGSEVYTYFMPHAAPAGAAPRLKVNGEAFHQALARKAATVHKRTALQGLNRPLVLLVQGAGDWVVKTFRPAFTALKKAGYRLSVFYADHTAWHGQRPAWVHALHPWEVYLDKADPRDLALYQQVLARVDVVFIATPDVTHAEVAKECVRRRVPMIFVEKPFDSHHANVESLVREMGFYHRHRAVLGLDHYAFYAAALQPMMPAIQRHLGGALAHVAFYMTETQPIEHGRERSLQNGMTLDLLPHMFALLTSFGAVQTVDDIRVVAAGQYAPLVSQDNAGTQYEALGDWYRSETYARVRFTYVDYAGNRVPCLGVVGKGLAQEVKYLEVTGMHGHAIRVDLGKGQECPTDYPYDSIFFLANPSGPASDARQVQDPYDPTRLLSILPEPVVRLDRKRYERLLLDLIKGTDDVLANVLLFDEAYEIVKALDHIWEATQRAKPQWRQHAVGTLDPVCPDEG